MGSERRLSLSALTKFPHLTIMKKQIHAYFSGRVQGVGFRYTSQDIARASGVSGWAKNLPDGRVEIVAEADESTLKLFLERINNSFSRYINDADATWSEATGEFRDFSIKF